MSKITAHTNSVIFHFEDHVKNGVFRDKTESGIYVPPSHLSSSNENRWAIVQEAGPTCKFIKKGDRVLVQKLKWTEGFDVDGETYWKTDERHIMAIDSTVNQ